MLLVASLDDPVGSIAQKPDELAQIAESMKDVATTGRVWPGESLTGPQPRTGVSDGSVRPKTLILQLQQPDCPGVSVAVLFETEQVAEGGSNIDADEDWLSALKDFVVCPDADGRQVAAGVE